MTALPSDVARLRQRFVSSDSSRKPKANSSTRQMTSSSMPTAMPQTSTRPIGCSARYCSAPLLEALSSFSPKASWSASQPMSRWTTP